MKAKELMIGDWVKVPCLNKVGKVYRIDYANGYGLIALLDGDFGENDIESIPLTAEILEKNGWKQKKGFMQHGNFGNGPLMIWHTEDNKILRHFTHEMEISDLSSDRGFRVRFDCNYVYQLQHALRLCGLEKEIKL